MKENVKKFYVAAFFLQFVVLIVCIALHRIFLHFGGMVGTPEMVGDEMSDPSVGRLIFALLAAVAFVVLSYIASKKAKAGNDFSAFMIGAFAGTFLWQSMGEDLWNFSIGGEHFIQLEGISVFPMSLLFILAALYCYRHNSLDWGIWCMVLSFAVNWYGHYVLLGIYPIFAGLCDAATWCKSVGIVLGVILIVLGAFLGLKKSTSAKQMMLSAILTYYAVAVLAFGVMEA